MLSSAEQEIFKLKLLQKLVIEAIKHVHSYYFQNKVFTALVGSIYYGRALDETIDQYFGTYCRFFDKAFRQMTKYGCELREDFPFPHSMEVLTGFQNYTYDPYEALSNHQILDLVINSVNKVPLKDLLNPIYGVRISEYLSIFKKLNPLSIESLIEALSALKAFTVQEFTNKYYSGSNVNVLLGRLPAEEEYTKDSILHRFPERSQKCDQEKFLYWVCCYGDESVLKPLLTYQDYEECSFFAALILACKFDNRSVVSVLLQHLVKKLSTVKDRDVVNELVASVCSNDRHLVIFEYLLKNGKLNFNAVENGLLAAVENYARLIVGFLLSSTHCLVTPLFVKEHLEILIKYTEHKDPALNQLFRVKSSALSKMSFFNWVQEEKTSFLPKDVLDRIQHFLESIELATGDKRP